MYMYIISSRIVQSLQSANVHYSLHVYVIQIYLGNILGDTASHNFSFADIS